MKIATLWCALLLCGCATRPTDHATNVPTPTPQPEYIFARDSKMFLAMRKSFSHCVMLKEEVICTSDRSKKLHAVMEACALGRVNNIGFDECEEQLYFGTPITQWLHNQGPEK